MKIFVAIPCYDGKVNVATCRSLAAEVAVAPMFGHEIRSCYLPGCSVITHARNILCMQFLAEPNCDRMVFIDSDVGWSMGSLIRLATYNKDVVAGIYRFKTEKEQYPMGFFTKKGETEFENGLCTASGIPMGFTAISRKALEDLAKATPERAYEFLGMKLHAFFENPFREATDAHPASIVGEDVAFSWLYRKHGGKIWVDPEMDLIHSEGLKEYHGNLGKYLKERGGEYTEIGEKTVGANEASA